MNLLRIRDIASVVQIVLAASTVWLAGGGSPWAWFAAIAVGAFAFARPVPPEVSLASTRAWTAVVFVALALSVSRGLWTGDLIDAGVDFLLLLVVQRLFQRQKTREHRQLVLLGAVFLIVAAVINADLNFPILLALYLPAAAFALVIDLLLAEGERLGTRVTFELARETPAHLRSLARMAGLSAIFAAICGLVVFVAFPRFGVGAFLRGTVGSRATSGFSDSVELGGFGTIKTDTRVVIRLRETFGGPQRPANLGLYLRGTSFDAYGRGAWSRSSPREDVGLARLGHWFVLTERGQRLATQEMGRQMTPMPLPITGWASASEKRDGVITLEDLGNEILFVPSIPIGIRIDTRGPLERVRPTALTDQTFRAPGRAPGTIRYEYVRRAQPPTDRELASIGDPAVPAELEPYTQVPEDLSEDFHGLARGLHAGAPTRIARVRAVMSHLEGFEYTTTLTTSARVEAGADPIEGFLFDTQEGHCEYFASALALLLREGGVPARVVNGYHGGHYNSVGDFWVVRQADAHSWVEVWFDGYGWIIFDATPADGREVGASAPWFPVLDEWVDAARNFYLQWVIDYDLQKQIDLLGGTVGGRSRAPEARVLGRILAVFVVVGAGVALIVWRRRAARSGPHPATRIYARVLARLRRLGLRIAPSEGADAIEARLATVDARLARLFASFAREYYGQRFGDDRGDPEAAARLRGLASEVERAARETLSPRVSGG